MMPMPPFPSGTRSAGTFGGEEIRTRRMVCDYCGRDQKDAEGSQFCRGCGAKSSWVPDPAWEPWEKAAPFLHNGYIVKVDRARSMDETVVAFWRGNEFLGEVRITGEEMVRLPAGTDILPLVIQKFTEEHGIKLPPEVRSFRLNEANWRLK